MLRRIRFFLSFVSFLLVTILIFIILFHDNTDHATHSLRIDEAEVRLLSLHVTDLIEAFKKEFKEKVSEIEELMGRKGVAENGKCLIDPNATQNPKRQLQSFIEGECAPVILVPGLMGTKLVIEIDCDILKQHHPEIMDACGWSTCSWSLWRRKPASEYLLWVPSPISPLSILSIRNSSNCLGHFVKTKYNASATTIPRKYAYPKGVRITWYGNSPKTQSKAEGGLSAIRNILPLPVQTQRTQAFAVLTQYLTDLGYQKGLTLFGVPYNFLQTYWANEVSYTFERTIRYAYGLTGKKVVIIGHSLGNLNALSSLNQMSQDDKDRMIAAYVVISPPFAGAPKALMSALGGDPSFQFGFGIGINFFTQARLVGGASSTQDLIPKDLYFRFKNETWMQDLLKRAELEKKYDPTTQEGKRFWDQIDLHDLPYSFFPNPSETCFIGFTSRNSQCMIGVSDLTTEPVVTISGKNYYANRTSIQKMIQEHYTLRTADDFNNMWNDSLEAGVESFTNPGVPIVYVYASHIPTEKRVEWDDPPELNTQEGRFSFPTKRAMGNGDGTVEVSFSLPPAFKWAWENINNGQKNNAKPIKIVELCSTYEKSGAIWDDSDVNGTHIMTTTTYVGLPCRCGDSLPTDGGDCFHSQMVNDPFVNELIMEVIETNQTVSDKGAAIAYKLSNAAIQRLQKEIPSLTRPRKDQNVAAWFQEAL